MKADVLIRVIETIAHCKLAVMISVIKINKEKIEQFLLKNQYKIYSMGINVLVAQKSDEINYHLKMNNGLLSLAL